jgi:hypothetical protein
MYTAGLMLAAFAAGSLASWLWSRWLASLDQEIQADLSNAYNRLRRNKTND